MNDSESENINSDLIDEVVQWLKATEESNPRFHTIGNRCQNCKKEFVGFFQVRRENGEKKMLCLCDDCGSLLMEKVREELKN